MCDIRSREPAGGNKRGQDTSAPLRARFGPGSAVPHYIRGQDRRERSGVPQPRDGHMITQRFSARQANKMNQSLKVSVS